MVEAAARKRRAVTPVPEKPVPPKAAAAVQEMLDHGEWTQNGFARAVGTSGPNMVRYLQGARQAPLSMALRAEELFGIPAKDWILPKRTSSAANLTRASSARN